MLVQTGYGTLPYGMGPFGGTILETTAFTDRWYALLPGAYREADEALGWPLLRWMSLLGDQSDAVTALQARFAPPAGLSELVDPQTADVSWLPWLGQFLGVSLAPGLTEQERRDAVQFASAGYRAGTKAAVADAARSALTGTRYVRVYDHSIAEPGDGSEWDVLLVTRVSETPDVDAVLQAVVDKRAKPAGVVLHHRAYSATYTQVQGGSSPDTYAGRLGDFPTYQDASDYMPSGA